MWMRWQGYWEDHVKQHFWRDDDFTTNRFLSACANLSNLSVLPQDPKKKQVYHLLADLLLP